MSTSVSVYSVGDGQWLADCATDLNNKKSVLTNVLNLCK